jgi:uncharacterized protein (DUF433 family)
MARPVLDALDALLNIRSGMSDSELMAKYNLSAKGLQSLFTKLVQAGAMQQSELDERPPYAEKSGAISDAAAHATEGREDQCDPTQRIMRPMEVAQDIRSGMSDAELMDKYRLSSKGLQNLFQELTSTDVLKQSELDRRTSHSEETVEVVQIIQKLGLDRNRASEDTANVPQKCAACGAPQTEEYDECPVCGVNLHDYREKKSWEERMAHAVWTCPACGRPQPKEFDECPVCGVIVSKYKKV